MANHELPKRNVKEPMQLMILDYYHKFFLWQKTFFLTVTFFDQYV